MSLVKAASVAMLLATVSLPMAAGAQDFSADRIRSDIAFLSDDLLEGRNAGDRGYDVAALYVANRFAALGLKPGGNDGSYYQQVPFALIDKDPARPSAMTIGGKRYLTGPELIIAPSPVTTALDEKAEAVFVGYGLQNEALGIDDYAGLDVEGKVVVYLYGTPEGLPSDVAASMNNNKGKTAAANGAVGTVMLATDPILARYPWERIMGFYDDPSLLWVNEDGVPNTSNPQIRMTAFLSPKGSELLFAKADRSWADIAAEIKDAKAMPKGFAIPGELRFERYGKMEKTTSSNVIGVIEGSDPTLAAQTVLLSGHLDHDGIVEEKDGDTIMNGAMDNASGVATMLEVARAFVDSGKRPKRSVAFVALTAEEDGLLGSDYLANIRTPATTNIVANVNLDMPLLTYEFSDVVAFGGEHSTMGPAATRALSSLGVKVSPDPVPEQGLFTRSDHYSFVKKGIPSIFLVTGYSGPGQAAWDDFWANHYHQRSDQIDLPFNWDSAVKFAKVNYLIAREIADAPMAPRWYEDSYFGGLFAPDAAKAKRAQ